MKTKLQGIPPFGPYLFLGLTQSLPHLYLSFNQNIVNVLTSGNIWQYRSIVLFFLIGVCCTDVPVLLMVTNILHDTPLFMYNAL